MPPRDVTIRLHGDAEASRGYPEFSDNAAKFLRAACKEMDRDAKVVKATFIDGDDLRTHNYVGVPNGLIMTVLEAYTNHRHLVLGPEDFEFAIFMQLNARRYSMEAGSKEQAEKGFNIPVNGIIHPDNYEILAETILSTLQKDAFEGHSDSHTPQDANNANPKDLFLDGAIPSVTLLGTKADWEKLGRRVSYISGDRADIELQTFCMAMHRLFLFFAKSFDEPTDADVISFWNLMCPQEGQAGWLAVFNFWDAYGEGNDIGYGQHADIPTGNIKERHVSPGYRLLDCHVHLGDGTKRLVKYVLGSVGTEFWRGNAKDPRRMDTVRPVSGSFMFLT